MSCLFLSSRPCPRRGYYVWVIYRAATTPRIPATPRPASPTPAVGCAPPVEEAEEADAAAAVLELPGAVVLVTVAVGLPAGPVRVVKALS